MPFHISNPEKTLRIVILASLSFMIGTGLVLVLAQIKPFWVDEWRIIYNLKYKSTALLFGPLDFMQQFPRVYLVIIKLFASLFDYSYFTLRFPSFLVGTAAIILCYHLMNKIFRQKQVTRFLFVMIVASSHAFTEYFVQTKQYTMEVFLSLLAIWQLLQLLRLNEKNTISGRKYAVLCFSFLAAPFFSYTYPIVVAPLFIIMLIQSISFLKSNEEPSNKLKRLFRLWFPLIVCTISVIGFYIIDVAQLMADKEMHQYWGYQMMQNGLSISLFLKNSFCLFSNVGAGLLFQIIFGVVGILAFVFALQSSLRKFYKTTSNINDQVTFYCVLLILFVFSLFIAGKIPLGEARLNIFTVPAIAFLIVSFFDHLKLIRLYPKTVSILTITLFVGVIGHIFTVPVKVLAGAENNKKLNIYVNTENAIILAQSKKMPIFITSQVAYPYNKMVNIPANCDLSIRLSFPGQYKMVNKLLDNNLPGDWVLKTFPAYKVNENTPVYALNKLNELQECLLQLPSSVTSVLAGDGRFFQVINR